MKRILITVLSLIFVFQCEAQDDPWWKSATIYQVYPRSFYDSDNDGIGDLKGVIAKLNYIQNLGFDAIWISPFFKSPQQDFGYDISDYISVDPVYGDAVTVDRLIDEVHKRDMKIVFDMVMNHTSVEHEWFKESLDSTSEKADWYIWQNGRGRKAPNNWKNMTGQDGWHYNPQRKQWYWSSFLPFQADLNWRNQVVKDTMFNTVRYWLDRGVDGFRLDIFNVLLEDSLFTPNPCGINYFPGPENPAGGFQRLRYNFNLPENYSIAKELRSVMNEYPDRFLIGEVDGKHEDIKGFLGENQDGLHSIFLFEFIFYKFSAAYFRSTISTFEQNYSPPYVPVYVCSNHDNRRSIGRVDGDQEKAKLLAMVHLTARGIAVVYQGEEFGSSDMRIPRKEALDPIAAYFHFPQFVIDRLPWLINRDECRTPVQWTSEENAGFTAPGVTTWLPVNPEYNTVNARDQLNDSSSLLNVYKDLLHLRKEDEVLRCGTATVYEDQSIPGDIYILKREFNGKKVWVMINFGKKEISFPNVSGSEEIFYKIHEPLEITGSNIRLKPYSGIIIGG